MAHLNLGRPGLSVLPLGVGDAFSVLHHPTCLLVSRYQTPAWDDELILVDCPQSIRRMMRDADDGRFHGLDLHRVNTLVLTHLHADHASGLETIAAFFKIVLKRRLRLVALPEVLEGVPRFLHAIKDLGTMEDLFDVVPVDEGQGIELLPAAPGFNSGLTLKVRRTKHPVPTAALRIWDQGRQFAYSCDTSFDGALWEWLWRGSNQMESPADLVVHEVGHGIHTSIDDILRTARTERDWGKRLWLIHYPDDLVPMLEDSHLHLMREGVLKVV